MRIAFLTHQWPGARLGGIGTYTSLCAHALARAGHETHVFTFPLPDDVRTHLAFNAPPNLTVHEVPGFAARVADRHLPPIVTAAIHAGGEASYRLGHAVLLTAALREVHALTPFDVVEAPEFEALALPLILEPEPNLAVITHLHSGSAINRLGNAQPATHEDLALDALESAVILGADALCAPTRKVAQITEQALRIPGLSTSLPITFIPIPVTPVADAEPNPPADGPLLFIGRLERLKGADTLAKALPAFLQACPTATVRILGPDTPTAPTTGGGGGGGGEGCHGSASFRGPVQSPATPAPHNAVTGVPGGGGGSGVGGKGGSMRQWMLQQIPESLRPRVEFLGERSRTDIAAELAACSFVLIPSLYESFSLVCAEAMAAARTAIVTRDIGTAELIGDAGVLVAREDPVTLAHEMAALYQNRPLLQKLSRAALQRARDTLAESVVIPQRLTFYQDALRRAKEARPTPPANMPPAPSASPSSTASSAASVSSTASSPASASSTAAFPGAPASSTASAPTSPASSRANVWLTRLAKLPQPQALALLGTLTSVTAFLAGNPLSLTPTPGSRLMRVLNYLTTETGRPVEFYLYGAGRHTARLLAERHLWESHNHRCLGLLDDHPRYTPAPGAAPATAWGLPILPRETLEKKIVAEKSSTEKLAAEKLHPIILSTDTMEDQFYAQTATLRQLGLKVFRLYS